ncbi:hypothetical protein V6N11_004512 [Hibiscus sabdariffa]|uniref:Reverse transcriptase zinc-binding domain-containing protein n=1 Tax=Hibiscus sabdariffa TaxID=183260 RepID=A0ABR2SGH0_9ROSI
MTTNSGEWDWLRLSSLLPTAILDQIVDVPPPQSYYSSDTLGWRWSDTREFSTRSAYAYLMDTAVSPSDVAWKRIWSLEVSQCILTFLWVTLHQRHLTNAERFRRHLASSALCSICRLDVEDLDHILRRCLQARNLWIRVIPLDCLEVFLRFRFFEECKYAFAATSSPICPAIVPQLWSKPPPGWIKGNVDALVSLVDGNAAIGCVLRDENGSWINGFVRDVGRCSILLVKLWAVHDSFAQVWSLDFCHVVIETECLEVIKILKHSSHALVGNSLVESVLYWTRKE